VQVRPVFDQVPVVASVSEAELAVAIESCTVEVIGADPVKVNVRFVVTLSVEDVPLSNPLDKSGVEGVGKT
jgi:hypothetical protein